MTVRLADGGRGETIGDDMRDGSIRVALVEDKRVIREGLGEILGRSAGIACVGTYASVEQALPGLEQAPCDVLLLDIHLPGMSGVDGVRAVLDRFPRTRILMLTVYEEEEKVFDSIRNGASGYLLKKTPPGQIVVAVRQAIEGGSPLSPEVARRMVEHFRRSSAPARPDTGLTEQERELLRLLAEGHSYAAAGERLGVSINTVRDHVRSLYDKLQVHSKSQAVSAGLRRGHIS
ncbi:MAG TPA: response regulator transcription factor [Thermoanaerobaculia bacterium]|jgi:DNA-binding NarL/FixJ family response regulator|nr:response regulator transcription factor [Thermoanaerobaculia bacterium]